ncbi:hypothetical protein [Ramlibacter humi]|uniref:Uncharacterized protein n=1 Tax=Ramlibacter humi TaxID=2530451 RepID=A0A4Z0CA54_9BURK|nr:hypothetical protein [Ramlibacter humi]TFZ07874.1 hypothetical protein EZ216_01540 [Ramlibacter humi]
MSNNLLGGTLLAPCNQYGLERFKPIEGLSVRRTDASRKHYRLPRRKIEHCGIEALRVLPDLYQRKSVSTFNLYRSLRTVRSLIRFGSETMLLQLRVNVRPGLNNRHDERTHLPLNVISSASRNLQTRKCRKTSPLQQVHVVDLSRLFSPPLGYTGATIRKLKHCAVNLKWVRSRTRERSGNAAPIKTDTSPKTRLNRFSTRPNYGRMRCAARIR